MKFYFKKDTGEFINARKLVGMENKIEEFGYVDFLGKGQYNIQTYHVFVARLADNYYEVFKTVSDNKANSYHMQGMVLVSPKGSNDIKEEYLQEEVELHEQV